MDPDATLEQLDPDATLEQLRDAILRNDDGSYSEQIAELFDALDTWLSSGGFLPAAWAR